jgi:hypothetical protein
METMRTHHQLQAQRATVQASYDAAIAENKFIDKSQIYLDKKEKRIIVSIYYGAKLASTYS